MAGFNRHGGADRLAARETSELAAGSSRYAQASAPAMLIPLPPGPITDATPTAGDDSIDGTAGDDAIDALAGNDTVNGLDGADTLDGNLGADVLDGGAGNDSLLGGDDNDLLLGGDGDDVLIGGAGIDQLEAGIGADTLFGGSGGDFFLIEPAPGFGASKFIGDLEAGDEINVGRNRFVGFEPDFYTTFIGTSAFSGNAGEVRYETTPSTTTILTDVDGDAIADYTIAVLNGAFDLRASDALAGALEVDAAYGSATAGDDQIGGTNGADLIDGGAGLDSLAGAGGDDTLLGGDDADVLDGGDGNDSLVGGLGDDTFQDVRGSNVIDGGDGEDLYSGFFAGAVNLVISDSAITNVLNSTVQTLVSIENISISQRLSGVVNDTLDGSLANISLMLFGGAGDDVIIGGAGADLSLEGDTGRDTLSGGTGADIFDYDFSNEIDAVGDVITDLEPGDRVDLFGIELAFLNGLPNGLDLTFVGAAVFSGLAGEVRFDRGATETLIEIDYDGDLVADGVITLANGAFTLFEGPALRLQIVQGLLTAGNDDYVGFNSDDLIDALDGDDLVQALAGADEVLGGGGNDTLFGGDGDDTLDGGADDDQLIGGAGSDSLDGASGSDTLTGGDGDDSFSFATLGGVDSISDFAPGDFISLGLTGLTSRDPGASLLTFIGISSFSGSPGEVRYFPAVGVITIEVDVDGDGAADQTILTNNSGFGFRTSIPNGPTLISTSAFGSLTAGDDTYFGSTGSDLIDGGAGADNLSGVEGDDTVLGGDGDDFISEGFGNDSIDGGAGFDSLTHFIGGPANVVITDTSWTNLASGEVDVFENIETLFTSNRLAPASDDTLDAGAATILVSLHAGAGNDLLIGGSGADLLEGDNGVDTLSGGAGNDIFDFDFVPEIDNDVILDLEAGDVVDFAGIEFAFQGGDPDGAQLTYIGNAAFSGSAGEFRYRWSGASTLIEFDFDGDTVADQQVIIDNRNVVLMETSPDSERLIIQASTTPTPGDDSLAGSPMNDVIDGLDGRDTIDGLGGDDTLAGAGGDDTLLGGDGADLLIGNAGADALGGGDGFDFASYQFSPDAVNVNLGTGIGVGGDAEGDTFAAIEGVLGSALNDTLTGNASGNSIAAGAGSDVVNGGGGDDTLDGSDGNDTLIGGAGADGLNGSTGTDTARYSSAAGGVRVALWNVSLNSGDAAGDTFFSIEIIEGSNLGDTLEGNGTNNDLRGGAGGDLLLGGFGNDTLFGQTGDDTLIGGAGGDSLNGADGFDIASYQTAGSGVRVALWNPATNTGDAVGDTVQFTIEAVLGSSFNDNLQGNSSDNVLRGGAGADFIAGGFGNDTLEGGAGGDDLTGGNGVDVVSYSTSTGAVRVALWNPALHTGDAAGDNIRADVEIVEGSALNDSLEGSASNNTLRGSGGADRILGGGGNDTLSGQGGNDTLSGGTGNDSFVFETGGGADVITDLAAGAGPGDVINLIGFGSAFDSFAEVIAASSQVGANVMITFGGGASLTLQSVTVASLDADDFLFG